MKHSPESLDRSKNLDLFSDPEDIREPDRQKDLWDMSDDAPENWDNHVEKANFEKYKSIWEKEKSEADRRYAFIWYSRPYSNV